MLENKKLNMVLSLIIAIGLWAFVIGEVNPEATRVYRDIPIQMINEDILDDSGLAVLSVSDTTVNVTVTGTRSDVNQISAKDITATVDLDQAALGENQLRVDVKVPSKVDIEEQSINKVTVVVEEEISKEVEVYVKYYGDFEGEEEPITVEQSHTVLNVTGAASNVERVAYVQAVVEEGKVTEELTTINCDLIPIDQNGLQVSNVTLSEETIQVSAELAKTKTVPLDVPIVESENTAVERSVTLPDSITVKGLGSNLDAISSITTEPLYLDEINETTTVTLVPILPDNVELSAENVSLTAVIQVTKMQSKTFTFDGDAIEITGLDETLQAQIATKTIKVTVMGKADLINSLSKEDFSLTADLSGLKAGTRSTALHVACSESSVELKFTPQTVKVNIEEIEEENNIDEEENIEE